MLISDWSSDVCSSDLLETLGVPVVAALNGSALGGGLELALAAHRRIALDNPQSQFGFPEVGLGILPGGGGIVRSVRMLGLMKALRSEERRVGKECVITFRSRGSPAH